MRIEKILLIFFLSFKLIISMDKYIPKSQEEEDYLQRIRERPLVLGIKNHHFADEKVDSESLNDILEELLKDYLQLNVIVKKGEWDTLHTEFRNGEIDIINLLTKTNPDEKFAVFSNKIFDEELVVVSKERNLSIPEDLNKTEIYVVKNSLHEKNLERFKVKNELEINILKVDSLDRNMMRYFADTNLNTIGEPNKLNISRLPESSIGIKREHEDLNNIINRALEEKYNQRIESWLNRRRDLVFKNKFLNSLTFEENEYLKELKTLKIGYGNIENVSNYSSLNKRFIGILPNLLNCLFKKLNINIIQDEKLGGGWMDRLV